MTQAFAPARFPTLAPPITPRQFGLFTVAQMPDTGVEAHWQNGVVALLDSHALGSTYVDFCLGDDGELSTPEDRAKAVDEGVATAEGTPFTVYSGFNCSAVGFSQDEINARAQAALTNGEERTVERLLLGDGVSDNGETVHPNVADDADDLGAFTTIPAALGALEQAIDQEYGGTGVVLVPRRFIAALSNGYDLIRSGSILTTTLGTKVAAVDDGGDPADGTGSLVGLGAIAVRRGAVEMVGDFASSLNRSINGVTRLAERTYVLLIDGPLLTAGITITGFPA